MNKNDLTNLGLVAAALLGLAIFQWSIFVMFAVFALTLGLLVVVHEWGHFIAARCVGVRVYEFALGFGPKLLTYMRRNGTDYTIRMFPLGGFVNPKGMQPDDPITEDGINGRRPAERALVYLAGPLMNMIFAVLLFVSLGAVFGTPDDNVALVGSVDRKTAAARMEVVNRNGEPVPANFPRGLRVGDRILEANGVQVSGARDDDGKPVDARERVVRQINPYLGKAVTLLVQRGRDTLLLRGTPTERSVQFPRLVVTEAPPGSTLPVQPGDQLELLNGRPFQAENEKPLETATRWLKEQSGREVTLAVWRKGKTYLEVRGVAGPLRLEMKEAERTVGVLGFGPYPGAGPRVGLVESASTGLQHTIGMVLGYVQMFQRPKELKESVGGPIAIASILADVGRLPLFYFITFMGNLSLSLAIFNLVPIPVFDGGHMLLLTIEVLRRKRLDPAMHKAAAAVGLVVVLVLFVLIAAQDLSKRFG